MNTTYPRNFGRWITPWKIGTIMYIAGDYLSKEPDALVHVERTVWMRFYQERSHCDTPGCCEMEMPAFGPFTSGRRVVDL